MDDARDAWADVATKVESLGIKLKYHLEQEADGEVVERSAGTTQNAFDALSGQVKDAFDAFGNAARDDAVHSDVRDVAELIKDALVETFQAVGAELGDLMEQIEDYAGDAAGRLAEVVGAEGADSEAGDASADGASDDIILESNAQDGAADTP